MVEPNAPPPSSMGLDSRIANIIGGGGLGSLMGSPGHNMSHPPPIPPGPPPVIGHAGGVGGVMGDPMRGGGHFGAASPMGVRGPPRPLPPPGPGMPGNLLGQGVGNLELAREEERGWPQPDRNWRGGRGRDFDRNRGGRWEEDRRAFDDRDRRDRRDFGRRREGGGRWDNNRREREWEQDDGWRGRRDERRGGQGPSRSRDRSRERRRDEERPVDAPPGGGVIFKLSVGS